MVSWKLFWNLLGQLTRPIVLGGFCQLDENMNLERGNLNWKNASMRLASRQVCGLLLWIIIHVGGPSSL